MFTTFKYTILRLVRNKANLFWILVFPIVLGCLFKVAFSNITASESFHTIPVAVVSDESTNAKAFSTMIDQLSSDDKYFYNLIAMACLYTALGGIHLAIGNAAMMFATVMPCCFLSGLMMGTMRMIVEQHIPWLNRINPAALISDCFYTLNNYDHLQRFTTDIVTLVIIAVIFCGISCLVTRRKTYASL